MLGEGVQHGQVVGGVADAVETLRSDLSLRRRVVELRPKQTSNKCIDLGTGRGLLEIRFVILPVFQWADQTQTASQ